MPVKKNFRGSKTGSVGADAVAVFKIAFHFEIETSTISIRNPQCSWSGQGQRAGVEFHVLAHSLASFVPLKLPDQVHEQPHSLNRVNFSNRFVQPDAGVDDEGIERSVGEPKCMAAEV